MPPNPHLTPDTYPLTPSFRPAFTFIEVLFAVVILGVGLIMIAGMLPVAIKQNADTRNDLTAKVVCDSGYAYLRTLIQTHPEAFPETCGDRGAPPPPGAANFGGEPFAPTSGSMLDQFMGDELMKLNDDDYTPQGTSLQAASDGDRVNAGILRAGRMMPLSFDVVHPPTSSASTNGGYDLGNLLANHAWNINPANIVSRNPEIDQYPLAWHQVVLGDRIVSSEPRFQWLAFYRRDEGSRVVKLVIVAMRQQTSEVTDRYRASIEVGADGLLGTADDVRLPTMTNEGIADPTNSNPVSTNGPYLVPVEIEDSLTGPDKVKFVGTAGRDGWDIDVAETGAFLIVAHSPPDGGPQKLGTVPPRYIDIGDLNRPFRNNGKIFRLAARRDDLDVQTTNGTGRVWELAPGYDLGPADAGVDQLVGTPDDVPDGSMNPITSFAENKSPEASAVRQTHVSDYPVGDANDPASTFVKGTTTWAWIIGRGHLDPTFTTDPKGGPFVGATQDLGVLTVDVPLP